MSEIKNPLVVRMQKAEWRRNKYRNNPEFRERERAYAREYYRKKHGKMGTAGMNNTQLYVEYISLGRRLNELQDSIDEVKQKLRFINEEAAKRGIDLHERMVNENIERYRKMMKDNDGNHSKEEGTLSTGSGLDYN